MAEKELVLKLAGGGPTRNPKKEVVGRDAFVAQMIERLEYTSIEMFAPRRLGKSWVLKLLEVKAPSPVMAVYMDLEGAHSTYEFVDNVATAFKYAGKRLGAAVGKFLEGIEIGHLKNTGHKFPWKAHLDGVFQKLEAQNKPVWLLMDEFPLFLMNLTNNEEKKTATEILDYFRYVRQNYKNIRFVLTGSIGLHWVIEDLEGIGWRNPQNDDTKMTLEPLDLKEATRLAHALFKGIGKGMGSAKELAEVVEGHPFYIQKAIENWGKRKRGEGMADFCLRMACKPDDPFEFADLHKRLGNYFRRSASLAKSILDLLAQEGECSVKEIQSQLKGDREEILNILNGLEKDGYVRLHEGRYKLIQTLFRKWWQVKQGGSHV